MAKHEISGCIYSCRHLSFSVVMQSPLRADTHTASCTDALLLSSSIIPPRSFLSSRRYITVCLCSSATRLASPSLIHPTCLSLPLHSTWSFLSPPHPSLPVDRPARPGIAPSTPRSPLANDFKGFFRSLSAAGFLKPLKTNVGEAEQPLSVLSVSLMSLPLYSPHQYFPEEAACLAAGATKKLINRTKQPNMNQSSS